MAQPLPEPTKLPDRALLGGLSALEQQALDLVYFRRYTQRQAAEILATSHRVVAAAVSRALQSVAAVMDTFDPATPGT